jgi:hypothetical protein
MPYRRANEIPASDTIRKATIRSKETFDFRAPGVPG